MSNDNQTANKPAFTPPASSVGVGNSPQLSTTDAELNAMYSDEGDKVPPATTTGDEKVVTDDKAKPAQTDDKKVGGYEDDSAKAAAGYSEQTPNKDAKDDKAAADSKETPKIEFDKTGHSEEAVKMIEGFAEANKLSKEQVEGFAGFIKSIQEAQSQAKVQAEQDARAAAKADFDTLKADKDFGGENLDKSFKNVSQVLDLMPEVKKYLTDTGSRLQPQIMFGLNRLHSKLFGQEGTIVQGGANRTAATLEPWNDFYN